MSAAPRPGLRPATFVIAAVAWSGVLLQACLSLKRSVDDGVGIVAGLGVFFGFFTVTTNMLVCLALTAALAARDSGAARRCSTPFVMGGLATSIAFVALSYHLLLRNIWNPAGAQLVADKLLHYVTPALFVTYWAVYVRRGALAWKDPLAWSLYPIAYFVYALVRGEIVGSYPYPFIDVSAIGYFTVTRNAIGLLCVFLLLGFAFVGIDKSGRKA